MQYNGCSPIRSGKRTSISLPNPVRERTERERRGCHIFNYQYNGGITATFSCCHDDLGIKLRLLSEEGWPREFTKF